MHPADRWGCGHYRLIWPAEILKQQGYDIEIVEPGGDSGLRGVMLDGRLVDANVEFDADIFVFQRPAHRVLVELIQTLRRKGKTVVVDMDDDLSCIHPKNAAFQLLHPKYSPQSNWNHVRDGCNAASLVTVSTPELLKRYGGVSNARMLRNCVPRQFLSIERPNDLEPSWGWAGALHSHPDDLPMIGGAVQMLHRDHRFMIVGYTDGTGKALGIGDDPPGTGRVEFEHWATALTNLRVGVAPLADTRFNRAKSWLKPLEYAAVGVPWVGSDRGEYGELQRLGGGFVVDDRTRNWVRVIRNLMTNDSLWQEASEQVRSVAAQFTVEDHAWRWLETWEAAWKLDHGIQPASVAG